MERKVEVWMGKEFFQVTEEELIDIRMNQGRGTILKNEGNIYFTPEVIDIKDQKHLCFMCKNAYPRRGEDGCDKVCDHFMGKKLNKRIVRGAARVEKYPFIISGAETINCPGMEAFIVKTCDNYKKDRSTAKYIGEERREIKLALGQYVFPEAETLADVKKCIKKQRGGDFY